MQTTLTPFEVEADRKWAEYRRDQVHLSHQAIIQRQRVETARKAEEAMRRLSERLYGK